MDLKLDGKIVVVTGGTGDIGSEIVKHFAAENCFVYFTYSRSEEKAEKLETLLGSDRCKATRISVLDKESLSSFAREIFEKHGAIDILVNNAAIAQVLPFPLIEEEEWDEVMDVNVKGTFFVTREFSRFMISKKRGCIINMGSIAGERIMEVPVHYAASKSAMVGFTYSLTKEFSRYNIRVNCVVPGLIEGGLTRNTPEKQKQQYIDFCAMKRAGKPEEVASLVVYLASPCAAYINGQVICIDGGI